VATYIPQPGDDGVDAGQQLAKGLRDLYSAAELQLITAVTAALKAGIQPDGTLVFRFDAFRALRRAANDVVDQLANDGGDLARQIVDRARKLGSAQAYSEVLDIARVDPDQLAAITRAVPGAQAASAIEAELRLTPAPPPPRVAGAAVEDIPTAARIHAAALPPSSPASELIEQELQAQLRSTEFRILRWAPDVYQRTVAAGAQQLVLGNVTPVQAQRRVWEDLSGRGVTGFIDVDGRGWDLTSYVEMATRSAAQRAWNEQHTAEYRAADIDLVMVSVGHDACRLCRPFQGAILASGDMPANADDLGVQTTIDVARAEGLQHNNCRCSYVPYIPDVTTPPQVKASAEASDERDQLRYLERGVRQWKRRVAAALTDDQAKAARVKVRLWQGRIRDHVASTSQVRKPYREQVHFVQPKPAAPLS
jgi:hypothetical protein